MQPEIHAPQAEKLHSPQGPDGSSGREEHPVESFNQMRTRILDQAVKGIHWSVHGAGELHD
jgi:hypothetical protein